MPYRMFFRVALGCFIVLVGCSAGEDDDAALIGDAGDGQADVDEVLDAADKSDSSREDDVSSLTISDIILEPAEIKSGESFQVVWSTSQAKTCRPVGDLPGWTEQRLGEQGPVEYRTTEDTGAGSYLVGVRCAAADGREKTAWAQPGLQITPGDPPPAPTLHAEPQPVRQEQPLTIRWDAPDTQACEAAGDLPGWSGEKPAGTEQEEIFPIAEDTPTGDYEVKLRCENAHGLSEWSSIQVTVQDLCANRPPPAHLTRRDDFLANGNGGTDFDSVYGPWPGLMSDGDVILERNEYAALAFHTDNSFTVINDDWVFEVHFFHPPSSSAYQRFGTPLLSISRCPGDFDQGAIAQDPYTVGPCIGARPSLWTMSWEGDARYCILQSNRDYYLNITTQPEHMGVPKHPDHIEWGCEGTSAQPCGASSFVVRGERRDGF